MPSPAASNFVLYPVVDNLATLNTLTKLGYPWLQYRNKQASSEQCRSAIDTFRAIAKPEQKLILNDQLERALELGFDGAHLGQQDLVQTSLYQLPSNFTVGYTVHNSNELTGLLERVRGTSDYIALGKIHASAHKQHVATLNQQALKQMLAVCRQHQLSTIAIGGLDQTHFASLKAQGFSGAAFIGWAKEAAAQEIAYSEVLF